MTETLKYPTLSPAAARHLENLLDIESERRPVDAALRSLVVDGRDALLCAASNLECGAPQSQPAVAAKLRGVADLLVELDIDHHKLAMLRSVSRLVRSPQLRQLAELVRRMPHDDAEYVAKRLHHIADNCDV